MEYTFDGRVRFSESDESGYLKYENFINYFQDSSTFQSEDLGLGVDYLKENNIVWMVASWQIEIIKYPKLCDKIKIGTFAYDFKTFLGYRNFFMLDENGEYLAKASSIWVLLNTETGRPEKATADQISRYGRQERLEMDYRSRKIDIPEDLKQVGELEVLPHHLDVNHHVNNGQYICMAVSCIPEMERPNSIRVEYKNQAKLGDKIYMFSDGNVVDLRAENGDSYCVVEIH